MPSYHEFEVTPIDFPTQMTKRILRKLDWRILSPVAWYGTLSILFQLVV